MWLPNKKILTPNQKPKRKGGVIRSLAKSAAEVLYPDLGCGKHKKWPSPLFIPQPLRMSPGYPCCCLPDCVACISGTRPSQVAITLPSLEKYSTYLYNCDHCDEIAGEYILGNLSTGTYSDGCYNHWYYQGEITCEFSYVIFNVFASSGLSGAYAILSNILGGNARSLYWGGARVGFSPPMDCNFNGYLPLWNCCQYQPCVPAEDYPDNMAHLRSL